MNSELQKNLKKTSECLGLVNRDMHFHALLYPLGFLYLNPKLMVLLAGMSFSVSLFYTKYFVAGIWKSKSGFVAMAGMMRKATLLLVAARVATASVMLSCSTPHMHVHASYIL